MGVSTVDTSSDIPSKYDLDGTELYGPEGKTIADLQELNPEDLKYFRHKKRAARAAE